MQAGIRDIFVMLSSRGATIVIALAFQSALAWLLGPDGRGQYAVCLTFQLTLTYFLLFGLDWSAKYYVASNKLSLSEAVSLFWTHLLLLVLVGCPLGFCISQLPVSFFDKAPPEAFLLSTFWMVSSSAFIIATAHLQALKEFSILAVCSIFYALLSLVIAIFCIYFLKMGLLGAIVADMISSTLIVIFIQFRLFARYRFSWQFPAATKIKTFMYYGWRTFIGTMAMQLNLRISTILLAFFSTEAQIGFFGVAIGFLCQIVSIPQTVGGIIQPRIAASNDGRPELTAFCVRSLFLFIFIIGSVFLLLKNIIILTLFPPTFLAIIPLLWILIPTTLIQTVYRGLFPYFNGTNSPEIVSRITVINFVANFFFLLVLLPSFGLIGAAWAVLLSGLCGMIYALYRFDRKSGIAWYRCLIPERNDFAIFYQIAHRFLRPSRSIQKANEVAN
jgi:O-antigen/teichoic acid export membrane protein